MLRYRALTSLFAVTLVGCSSGDGAPVIADAVAIVEDSASPSGDSHTSDETLTADDSAVVVTDVGPCGKREQPCCGGATCESGLRCETVPTIGATCLCDTSLCDRFGYVCDGNKQVACGPTAPGSCYVPLKSVVCPSDSPCNAATGTCGGCNASDLCSGKADGTFLGCAPYTAEWCRKGTDGCVKTVRETCGIACVGGSRQGCCGGEGQMCCSPPGAACATGLSCKSALCSK